VANPDYSAWATQSSPYDAAISQAEQKYGLPPGFLRKQLIVESSLNPSAVSTTPGSHATGIAQFQPATSQQLGVDPTDPLASIDAAAKADAGYYKQFGSWGKTLLAYHDGPTAVAEGRVSPAALQYRSNFQQVPSYTAQTAPPTSGGDPFATVDQAHATQAQATAGSDPFATVDQAHAAAGGAQTPVATPHSTTPQQDAQSTYDAMSFPERVFTSAGSGLLDVYHGAQGLDAMIRQGMGHVLGIPSLEQGGQADRERLAQEATQNAPYEAGEHGLANFVGQALPYVASAPVGGPEAAGARALLSRVALAAGRNALAGGVIGGVASTPTDKQGNALPLGQEAAARGENALLGAGAGAVLSPVAEGVSTGLGKAAQGVTNKLTSLFGGAERTAAGNIASAVPGGMGAPNFDAAAKIPGYNVTAAEATQDPRVAWLDKQMRSQFDDYRAKADATDQSNNQAMQNVVDNMRGDRSTLAKLYADRSAATTPLYEQAAQQAVAQGARVDATPVWTTLTNLIQGKQGETSVTNALGKYLQPGSLYDQVTLPNGQPGYRLTNDIQRLTNVRNQMSTDIGKQFTTDSSGQDMRAAARPLMQVRDVIDDQLAQANPALAQARQTFSQMSQGINQQEYLQGQLSPEKFTDGSKLTASKLQSVLTNINNDQSASGANPAKSLTSDQVQQLSDLHDVLANRENAQKMQPGKDVKDSINSIVGTMSNTGAWNPLLYAQHAGTAGGMAAGMASNFLELAHLHPAIAATATMMGGLGGGAIGRALARSSERSPGAVRDAMADMLLNPQGSPVPNVSPSQYVRSAGGQKATNALVRASTNALINGAPNNGNLASQPSP
jgi:hypothetical protein